MKVFVTTDAGDQFIRVTGTLEKAREILIGEGYESGPYENILLKKIQKFGGSWTELVHIEEHEITDGQEAEGGSSGTTPSITPTQRMMLGAFDGGTQ